MGAASSSTVDCASACALGEPQEVCDYGAGACDWDNAAAQCRSRLQRRCVCPAASVGVQASMLGPHIATPADAAIVMAGPVVLWALTVLIIGYRLLHPPSAARPAGAWKEAPFPGAIAALTPRWMELCLAVTAVAVLAVGHAPADLWGECSARGTCVYHQMFCEATRHGSAARHPANFWSNLPYVYIGTGLLWVGAAEGAARGGRPFRLLDTTFALVLLGMAAASFAWHGSNCTAVHFVDIGLMNCVIAFFPFRFLAMALARASGLGERALSTPSAVAFGCVCAQQMHWALGQTDLYHEAFPTGRARSKAGSLDAVQIALYLGLPGLYPLPTLLVMRLKRTWGHVPAIFTCLVALPLAFVAHGCERLVVDLACSPTSSVQPTAIFHVASAVAIAAAYVQARALGDE